jgi:hypothetical protein
VSTKRRRDTGDGKAMGMLKIEIAVSSLLTSS